MKNLIPTAALAQHIAILGKTGSGKTSTAKAAIVEPLLDHGAQVCIIDPTSAWWGLRLSADGKRPGYERVIILGGERGDLPLSERSGEAVARLVTEQGASCIIDTGGFTVGEYTRWFIAFATALYTGIRHPLHLIIDEAHHFMPQGKSPDVDAGRMLHAGNRLMSGGRSRGIRGVLITQRPAKLHKDSLTCADTLIPHRVIAPQDRAAIKDWIDGAGDAQQGKAVLDSLASLQRGEAWVWYPEGTHLERVQFPMPKTFDSSKAPTAGGRAPKVGEIDLSAIKSAMADAVKEAEANDPKKLRARIAELEREAKKPATMQTIKPDGAAIDRAVAKAHSDDRKEYETRVKTIKQFVSRIDADVRAINGQLTELALALENQAIAAPRTHIERISPRKEPIHPVSGHKIAETTTERISLDKPTMRILHSLAWWSSLGVERPTVGQAAAGARYAASGSFDTYLSRAGTAGLLVRENGTVRFTDAGRAAAPVVDTPLTLDELHGMILQTLDGPATRIVKALIQMGRDADPTVAELAAACSPPYAASGSFDTYLSRLGTKGLIERRHGRVKATDTLMPKELS